ncbi:MAG: hypothetical protein AAGA92_09850 [Planctomycetota bacterium]
MQSPQQAAVRRYLEQLKQALRGADRSVRTTALSDAAEFLASEVGALSAEGALSEEQLDARFAERFGTPTEVAAEYLDAMPQGDEAPARGWWSSIAAAFLVLALSSGVAVAMHREYPKVSPFTKVEFEKQQVLVDYEGKTYEWLELDGVAVDEITDAAKKQFGRKWQKRTAEDLVEVLSGMGHTPGPTVSLKLRDPETREETLVTQAVMTEENRRELYAERNKETLNLLRSLHRNSDAEPPKLSPFTRVEFEGGKVLVNYEGRTYEWLALDGFSVEKIAASAKRQFGERWEKRIAEDLIEVLWGMKHLPGETVSLRLRDVETREEKSVEAAAMTEANRRGIWLQRNGDKLKAARE